MHLWLRLGIIQVNLASALALHKRSVSVTSLCCEIAKLRKLSQVAFCGGSSKSKLLNDGFCRRFFFIDHKDKNIGQLVSQRRLYRPFIDHFLCEITFIDHFRINTLQVLVDIIS